MVGGVWGLTGFRDLAHEALLVAKLEELLVVLADLRVHADLIRKVERYEGDFQYTLQVKRGRRYSRSRRPKVQRGGSKREVQSGRFNRPIEAETRGEAGQSA